MEAIRSFFDQDVDPHVRGWIHTPENPRGDALILTHGAGGDCAAPLLAALAEASSGRGYTVLRCDLPFRQVKRFGPPFPGNAERDRAGLRNAVAVMRKTVNGKVFLGGHSYGGRQASMLCAQEPDLASGLLLLSYPLHPLRKPEQLRTQHLPDLRTPCLFIQGTRDPFGSIEDVEKALQLVPSKHQLLTVDGAGHDLGYTAKSRNDELPARIVAAFQDLIDS
ncbi:MAG: alpha/beta hydrolase family protein [Bryobacteraceae bacterium]